MVTDQPSSLSGDQPVANVHTGPGPSAAHARTVAHLVTPLIADTLALQQRLTRFRRAEAAELGGSAPQLVAALADQLGASADLMRACVRGAGGTARTRRADAYAADAVPDDDGVPGSPSDAVRRLLADEDRVARRLRDVITACDDSADDGTADRLQEVLDEIAQQRWFLSDLLRS